MILFYLHLRIRNQWIRKLGIRESGNQSQRSQGLLPKGMPLALEKDAFPKAQKTPSENPSDWHSQ